MSHDQPIQVTRQGQLLTVTLNAPPLNPIGIAQVHALTDLFADIAEDKSVRVIIVQGTGEHFSVGANLKEGNLALEQGPKAFVSQHLRLFDAIEHCSKPVIAAIRGYCLGGGMELAMACHFRVADDSAQLSLPEIDLGAAPMWSGASRALRLVGRARALELLMLGQRIDAQQALHIGLVNRVFERAAFDQELAQFAQFLAEKPPLALAAIIRVINRSQDLPLQEALAYELDAFSALSGTRDMVEGVTALFEKRKPLFIGE